MTEFPHPLRLAVGSHVAGSGAGCAMNVISYENGDKVITDLPSCSAGPLAVLVQEVNDTICTHRTVNGGVTLLCTDCSQTLLDLGHATVGTGSFAPRVIRRWLRSLLIDSEYGVTRHLHGEGRAAVAHIADLLGAVPEHKISESTWQQAINAADRTIIHDNGYPIAATRAIILAATYAAAHAHYVAAYAADSHFAGDAARVARSAAVHAIRAVNPLTDDVARATRLDYARWAIAEWHLIAGTSPVASTPEITTVALAMMYGTADAH